MRYKIKRFSVQVQKEFTRAEKKAFLEMYRKIHTNDYNYAQKYKNGSGYRKVPLPILPDTSYPRDVLRLNKLAIDWNNIVRGRGTNNVDIQSAKTLFKNADMPKMSDQVEKIVNKYSNKEAIARLKRIKESNPKFKQKFEKVNQNTERHLNDLEHRGNVMGEYGLNSMRELRENNPNSIEDLKQIANYATTKKKVKENINI